ncbi:MAG: hypothetical protein V7637_1122 [Mycobacteriales bacterium]|jgi:hypothetical protein
MALARPSTVLLAGVIDAPAIYQATVTHELPAADALIRYLIAVPVAAVLLGVLRRITAGYGQKEQTIRAVSARLDADEPQPPAPPPEP